MDGYTPGMTSWSARGRGWSICPSESTAWGTGTRSLESPASPSLVPLQLHALGSCTLVLFSTPTHLLTVFLLHTRPWCKPVHCFGLPMPAVHGIRSCSWLHPASKRTPTRPEDEENLSLTLCICRNHRPDLVCALQIYTWAELVPRGCIKYGGSAQGRAVGHVTAGITGGGSSLGRAGSKAW